MSVQIAAALLDGPLEMRVGTRELAPLAEGEALVRVEWAGLCGSDLHVIRTGAWVSEWPATLGHEVYGRIESVRGGGAPPIGTPVVIDSRIPCNECDTCRVRPDGCPNLRFVGEACPGGFATHCALPVTMLHEVPEGLEGATAVLAEPLAVVLHGLGHLRSEPARVAILGHGPIGALVHLELRRRFGSVEVVVAEPAVRRAALARALGAETVAEAGALTAGSFDLIVDAAGYRGSLAHALELGSAGAQIILLALGGHPEALTPLSLVERRLTLTGSNAFIDELPEAIALLAAEGPRYEVVVTDRISLDELPDAVERQLRGPDAVKLLVRP